MSRITCIEDEIQQVALRYELKARLSSIALSLSNDLEYDRKDAIEDLIKIVKDI